MAVKLLLVEDVDDLGKKGEIVSVRPGFARNYLLPQGFAIIADKGALNIQARLQEERRQKAITDLRDSEQLAGILETTTLFTTVKVDHEGKMYGSVSLADIMDLLEDKGVKSLEKRSVQLKHSIKELGTHKIDVKLKEGVTSSFTLEIAAEETK